MNVDDLAPVRSHGAAAAAIMVTGAGWIHLLAVEDHWAHAHIAVFFAAVALLQLSWAALVLYHATGRLLLLGLVGNLGLVVLWVISRTTGVVFVPGVRQAEPVGLPDAAASGLELVAATTLVLLLTTWRQKGPAGGTWRLVAGAAALTLPLVVAAGLSATPHHHEHLPLSVHP